MDDLVTQNLKAAPFIAWSYGIGAALLFGWALWLVRERGALRRVESTLKKG